MTGFHVAALASLASQRVVKNIPSPDAHLQPRNAVNTLLVLQKKPHMCPVSVLWFEVFVCVWLMLNFPPHRKAGEYSGLNGFFFLSLQ